MSPRRTRTPRKNDEFWNRPSTQSRVKARIVAKCFTPWTTVMIAQGETRIGYVDLSAGRGRYRDGTPSTPVLILEHAIKQPPVAKRLLALLNDADPVTYEHLRNDVLSLPNVGALAHAPILQNDEVNGRLAEMLQGMKLV